MSDETQDTELILLRDFYAAWKHLHSYQRGAGNRRQMEIAAQELVDCGQAIERFNAPCIITESLQSH